MKKKNYKIIVKICQFFFCVLPTTLGFDSLMKLSEVVLQDLKLSQVVPAQTL